MLFSSILSLFIVAVVVAEENSNEKWVWTWKCEENRCLKKEAESNQTVTSLEVCRLSCGDGVLWPQPTGVIQLSNEVVYIDSHSVDVKFHSQDELHRMDGPERVFQEAARIFKEEVARVQKNRPNHHEASVNPRELEVNVILKDPSVINFSLDLNESYVLYVNQTEDGKANATILADNFFGGRNGLETLSQLVVFDPLKRMVGLPSTVLIEDGPQYPYRGVLLDTSRNFISIPAIKRTIDAMSTTKLNTFHWHITDSQSFPLVSDTFPQLTQYGAYDESKVYTKQEIKDVVEYGRVRGVRVLPEFDAPAHVGEGWQWAGDATVCYNAQPWQSYCVEPPCGQLNPTSEKMYEILEGIYKDMDQVFDSDLFHMGGDEVNINCWNSSKAVYENMDKLNLSRTEEGYNQLWSIFQERALSILEKVNGKERPIILWTSGLTAKNTVDKYLSNKKYIIQIWTKGDDALIGELLKKGFRVIFSNYDALYFDCGFSAWVGHGNNWCSPYVPWQTVYDNDPLALAQKLGVDDETAKQLILGAEATLWTEQADDASVDQRLWPRAAAMGERLWGTTMNWKKAQHRFYVHRDRLVDRQIMANTVQPGWCVQNPGFCYA